MPKQNTDIMKSAQMRRLFACAAADAYLKQKIAYLRSNCTDQHRICRLQQWIEVALQVAEYCIMPGFTFPEFEWFFAGDIDFGINFLVFARERYKKASGGEKRLLSEGYRRSMANTPSGQRKYSPDASILEYDPLSGAEMSVKKYSEFRTARDKYSAFLKQYRSILADIPGGLICKHFPGQMNIEL